MSAAPEFEWDTWHSRIGALNEALRIGLRVSPPRGCQCSEIADTSWVCTRRPGHGGRHVAALSDGLVVAVWRQA